MNCSFKFIISNGYGKKCLNKLLQLKPCSGTFEVISDIMAHWYEMINALLQIYCKEIELSIHVYYKQC